MADEPCPWLDAATASGVLGGPVAAKTTTTTCEFVRTESKRRMKLRIEVHRSTAAREEWAHAHTHCGAAAEPLKAIGNEAFLCSKTGEIVGRVRDAFFTVRIITPDHTSAASQAKTKDIAEQVAGMLF